MYSTSVSGLISGSVQRNGPNSSIKPGYHDLLLLPMCGFLVHLFTPAGRHPLQCLLVSDCCSKSVTDCRVTGDLGCRSYAGHRGLEDAGAYFFSSCHRCRPGASPLRFRSYPSPILPSARGAVLVPISDGVSGAV
jgi:hypothetical protein